MRSSNENSNLSNVVNVLSSYQERKVGGKWRRGSASNYDHQLYTTDPPETNPVPDENNFISNTVIEDPHREASVVRPVRRRIMLPNAAKRTESFDFSPDPSSSNASMDRRTERSPFDDANDDELELGSRRIANRDRIRSMFPVSVDQKSSAVAATTAAASLAMTVHNAMEPVPDYDDDDELPTMLSTMSAPSRRIRSNRIQSIYPPDTSIDMNVYSRHIRSNRVQSIYPPDTPIDMSVSSRQIRPNRIQSIYPPDPPTDMNVYSRHIRSNRVQSIYPPDTPIDMSVSSRQIRPNRIQSIYPPDTRVDDNVSRRTNDTSGDYSRTLPIMDSSNSP
jgi:hypothetical protein